MSDATPEVWLPISGFDGYEVSNLGRVWSSKRWRGQEGRILKAPPAGNGYPTIHLYRGHGAEARTVHHLVCEAFHGPPPEGQEVRHLDGNRANCAASNLAWGTHSENNLDAVRHGTHHWAARTKCNEGHDLVFSRGRRRCPICNRAYQREWMRQWRASRTPTAS